MGRSRDATEQSTHRTAFATKNSPAPNVKSAKETLLFPRTSQGIVMQVDLGLRLEIALQVYSCEQPAQDCTDGTPLEGRAYLSVLNPQHLTQRLTQSQCSGGIHG